MCDCIDWYYVITLICIVIFFQILMYKLGYMQGEKSAYNRLQKYAMSAETVVKKCNSSEKSNSWRLI